MNYTEQQLTAAVVSEGLRPALAGTESGAPPRLLSLIQRCWDADTQNRPSFDDIINELDLIIGNNKILKVEENLSSQSSSNDDITQIFQHSKENINWFVQGENIINTVNGSGLGVKNRNVYMDNSSVYLLIISWGSFATCGRRETMEDTHFLMPNVQNAENIHIFGIFDGHRGGAAAEYSVRALPRLLQQTLDHATSPIDALKEAFINTDVAFRKELNSQCKSKKDYHPGCTAVAALIVQNRLVVANAGDCRAILCRAGCAIPLSKDHVASCLEERKRVMSVGGEVKWQFDT